MQMLYDCSGRASKQGGQWIEVKVKIEMWVEINDATSLAGKGSKGRRKAKILPRLPKISRRLICPL